LSGISSSTVGSGGWDWASVFSVGDDGRLPAGEEGGVEAGVEVTLEAGVEAGLEAGVEAALDAGEEATLEAGVEAALAEGPPEGVLSTLEGTVDTSDWEELDPLNEGVLPSEDIDGVLLARFDDCYLCVDLSEW
jgi:hypothetical protein